MLLNFPRCGYSKVPEFLFRQLIAMHDAINMYATFSTDLMHMFSSSQIEVFFSIFVGLGIKPLL